MPFVFLCFFIALAAGGVRAEGATWYVAGSVARLRSAPRASASVRALLRIAEPLRVLNRREEGASADGSYWRVRAFVDGAGEGPVEGYVERHLLASQPPTMADLLAELEQEGDPRARRRLLERAAALDPSDERVIQGLIAVLQELGDQKSQRMAQKGLVAAQKRNASWDGPLYPTLDALTYVPRPCPEGAPPLAGSRRERLQNEDLRARAFDIVNSGKVVSVTTRGYQTQLLDRQVCLEGPCGDQLGYALPRAATSGALVPSWMVAGHRVTGYREAGEGQLRRALGASFPCVGCRHFLDESARSAVQVDGPRWRLLWRNHRGAHAGEWQSGQRPYARARPIARFDESLSPWRLLWLAEGGRETCPEEHSAWLVRLRFAGEDRVGDAEEGALFFSGLAR